MEGKKGASKDLGNDGSWFFRDGNQGLCSKVFVYYFSSFFFFFLLFSLFFFVLRHYALFLLKINITGFLNEVIRIPDKRKTAFQRHTHRWRRHCCGRGTWQWRTRLVACSTPPTSKINLLPGYSSVFFGRGHKH
jgi:hypothetical protein